MPRDHCDEADRLFAEQVPAGLVAFMREHADGLAADVAAALEAGAAEGTWEEVFGPVAEEMFQTYYTAAYVDAVTSAGKEEYPIPMAVNCWLDKGHEPGRFPTGGPNARVLEIWKWAAPSLDACGPDIYVRTFCDDCDNYRKLDNPLFIPETATHAYAARHHHARLREPDTPAPEDLLLRIGTYRVAQSVIPGCDTPGACSPHTRGSAGKSS